MLVHLLDKEGRGRASECLKWAYVDIGGSMPVASTCGREYVYVTDAYTRAVYTRLLRLKSEVMDASKTTPASIIYSEISSCSWSAGWGWVARVEGCLELVIALLVPLNTFVCILPLLFVSYLVGVVVLTPVNIDIIGQ